MSDKFYELMELLDPADINHLTADDMVRLHNLVKEGQVDARHLAELYLYRPEAAQVQLDAQAAITAAASQMVNGAAAGQRQTIAAMESLTGAMAALAAEQSSDDPAAAGQFAQIATDFSAVAGNLTAINRDNNRTWSRMAATVAVAGVGLFSMAATYMLNREAR